VLQVQLLTETVIERRHCSTRPPMDCGKQIYWTPFCPSIY